MFDWREKTGKAYITSGTGYGKTELAAFDAAELDANIMATNAIKVSSFVPPHWEVVNSKEDLGIFTDNGVFLPMAYAYAVSSRNRVAASIVIGINKDTARASIIAEHADSNVTRGQSIERSTTSMEETFRSRGWEIGRSEKVSVEGAPRQGLYVCVLVAVVFLADPAISRPSGTR